MPVRQALGNDEEQPHPFISPLFFEKGREIKNGMTLFHKVSLSKKKNSKTFSASSYKSVLFFTS